MKRVHTLAWIDTNIKLLVEDICAAASLPAPIAVKAAELAQQIFALFLKANDHELAGIISFNESVYLQNRIVHVLLGSATASLGRLYDLRSLTLNSAAEEVALDGSSRSLPDLLYRAVVAGGAITRLSREGDLDIFIDGEELAEEYSQTINECLNEEADARSSEFDRFVSDVALKSLHLGWVFDDNGESVFDLVFLDEFVRFRSYECALTLLLNSINVSDNINSAEVRRRLAGGRYQHLQALATMGRLVILDESQYLAGMEPFWLSSSTKSQLLKTDTVFLKGINLYESFQHVSFNAFYGFVVHGPNAIRLVGLREGSALVLHSPRGHAFH